MMPPTALPLKWPDHVRLASGRTRQRKPVQAANAAALAEQRGRHWRGALSECVAALWLILKGYRIIERGNRNRFGEIDLIAIKGRRMAFVEVKFRRTIEAATAAISGVQQERIGAAAENWVWRHPRYHDCEIGLDAILIVPGCLPRHAENALQPHC
jgi:putative endonuclease